MALEEVSDVVGACWVLLFVNGVIARGFPIPKRYGEQGIELPFVVMVSLAKTMYPVYAAGGVYLKGFSNILFPTRIFEMGTVQWHLMTMVDSKTRMPNGKTPNEDEQHTWDKTGDLETLTSASRTFLGYCRRVDVHLGTEKLTGSIKCVGYSGLENEKPGLTLKPRSVTTSTSGMGIWGLGCNIDITLPKGLFVTIEAGWYSDMVDDAKNRPIIVCDVAKEVRRAWLVPTLGVALHMAYIWARDKEDLVSQLPFAAVGWDSGQAAYDVIKNHSKDVLRDESVNGKDYLVKDLLGRLLSGIDEMREAEALAQLESGRTISLSRSKLHGWDLLAIAQGKHIVSRQQLDTSAQWRSLGSETLTLFCRNVGKLIVPDASLRICSKADTMLNEQDLLFATIKCLRQLSEEKGGYDDSGSLKLANHAYWCPGKSLCWGSNNCASDLTAQRMCCSDISNLQQVAKCPSSKTMGSLPDEGAVVFGSRKAQSSQGFFRRSIPVRLSASSKPQDTPVCVHLEELIPVASDGPSQAKKKGKLPKQRVDGVEPSAPSHLQQGLD